MKQADAYFELAPKIIAMATSPRDLRSWWLAEKRHRREYGLSQDQIDRLVKLCAEHVALLEEGHYETKEPEQRRRGHRQRKRPAI